MSATQYTPDLHDMDFVLHDVLSTVSTLHTSGVAADMDQDLMDTTIAEAARMATDLIGPINGPGDREGCHLNADGTVRVPEGYIEAYKTFMEGGWPALAAPVEFGGMGLPGILAVAIGELITGACPAFAMYPGLTRGAANLLAHFAPPAWRVMVCEKLFSGEWGGTMCLTEPGAGSAVGASRTRAAPTDRPGVYQIQGEKIFISSGDHPLTENIVHLVLARTPDAPKGTRGLSIFLVPKFEFDFATGALGERNGVFVEKVEEKMGIHGNATCALSFGARQPCRGWLLGEEGQGMKIMFHMMNEARLEVGVQGLSGAASAYQNALSYAKGRIQGQSLEQFGNPEAPQVPIIEHPDVRRMLL
ncbi:MAG TPA: acyl-CoA dehydrogenase, partial [Deltaproteobacteria bacterium]|nr:acyl-CoA dehydrogenase [Deltaproteobacteria bacterium]